MRSIFKRLYFFNLDLAPKFSNSQKRIQRLLIINYFLVFAVPVIIISDLFLAFTGKQPYTFEKFPVLIYWILCLIALILAKKNILLISKLITIFLPLCFISVYSLTGYIIGEHFLWQPVMILGISIIPFLVLDFKKEKVWLITAFLCFLIYVIFHDRIMLLGANDTFTRVFNRLNTTPFIYNTVRIAIFLFLTLIVYYSIRLNDHQQLVNEQINNSLRKTSDYLGTVNSELQAHRNAINNSASLLITDEVQNIESINNNFLSVSGYLKEELIGKPLSDLIYSYYEKSFYDIIIKTLGSGEVWRGELKLNKKDGSHFWMQTAISTILDRDDEQKGYLVIMFNITNTKDHEERLVRLNLEKDRILYAVAHDLKNPLMNFKALLNLLKSGMIKKEEEEEIFGMMTRDCDHSVNLIGELLEIGRLEDENFVLTKTPTDLNAFLEKSLESFEQSAQKKGIKFTKDFSNRLITVGINEKEFIRVVYNLINNAIKFTPKGGEITVGTNTLDHDKVSIKISDTGVGISQDLIPIIFDKFSKASRAGIEGEKSTGLGMWIVKHIVQLHKGEISVESHENKGTTFSIILPV
ncbi:MAG: PAS domain-containing sensor histidine kinase [Cytophagales bacterium]|nr:PAS domain-containing sensor histidine kinase [Cytophagales bacterium]